jgi:hypothetical protein
MSQHPPFFITYPQNCEKFYQTDRGETVFVTKETLEREEKVCHEKNVAHQFIQILVALSSLKEFVVTCFLFKGAYLSIFAKGDDKMIFDRIENTLKQLRQVSQEQKAIRNYVISPLYFSPPTMFQIISNEIVEHFSTAVKTIKQCIGGRNTSNSGAVSTTLMESFSQTWKWEGWKQIGMTALCSLNTIVKLVNDCKKKFSKDESVTENGMYLDDFLKVAECLILIVKGFMVKKYPEPEMILSVFKDDDFLSEENLNNVYINENYKVGSDKEEVKVERKKGIFESFFGGI